MISIICIFCFIGGFFCGAYVGFYARWKGEQIGHEQEHETYSHEIDPADWWKEESNGI